MNVTDLNGFDWFLVLVTAYSMLAAFRRGLIRAIFGLLGFVGGFLLATWNYVTVGDWIFRSRMKVSLSSARILGFLLIVIVTVVAFEFLGKLMHKLLRTVGLGWFDRLLGMVFGFARGCLMGIAALMAATTFAPQSDMLTKSAFAPYLFAVAHDVSFLVPQYLQQLMVTGAIDFKHGSPHWINRH